MLWVIGANGQVGRAIVRLASERGLRFQAFSRGDNDIRDHDRLADRIGAASVLINAAAYTAVDAAEKEPEVAHAINAEGPAALARLAAARNMPFIHFSTDYVFDGTSRTPYKEQDPIAPVSVYGRSKADGETAVRDACAHHVIIRTAWIFSATGHNFVRTMLRLASQRSTLRVVCDQRGGPTAAEDIAEAVLRIAENVQDPGFEDWGTYHFAGQPPTTWYEFARAIFADRREIEVVPIASSEYPTPASRPANSVLDCQRMFQVFGIGQPDWHHALSRVLAELGAGIGRM
jgi:dTDP-4-dehydrorhamnose reductase